MGNPKTRALLIGGAFGLLVGVLAGFIYYNSNAEVDSEGTESLEPPSSGTAVKIAVGVLGVLRLITS